MWQWLLGPKEKSPDSYVVSPYTDSHMVSKKLEGLNKEIKVAGKEFSEAYYPLAEFYKRHNFEDAYLAAIPLLRKLMGACESHNENLHAVYSMSMRSGAKPFGSYDVFYHLFDPLQSLTRGLVLSITCVTMMREDGIKGDFPELVSAAERFEKLVRSIVHYDKEYRKGDRREDVKKMSKFIDAMKADSGEILKLAKKVDRSKLKLEELQKAKVVNREY